MSKKKDATTPEQAVIDSNVASNIGTNNECIRRGFEESLEEYYSISCDELSQILEERENREGVTIVARKSLRPIELKNAETRARSLSALIGVKITVIEAAINHD